LFTKALAWFNIIDEPGGCLIAAYFQTIGAGLEPPLLSWSIANKHFQWQTLPEYVGMIG